MQRTSILEKYGIPINRIKEFYNTSDNYNIDILLYNNGIEDGLVTYCINKIYSKAMFMEDVSASIGVPVEELENKYNLFREANPIDKAMLTGADAVAIILAQYGIKNCFGYPGTSELSICSAFKKHPNTKMINGRGDKESAFEAAGANIYNQGNSLCILHGARGLTNALGAIADVRRNEIGVLCLVGMPSTQSNSFLPPHGEINLISSAGNFSKSYNEIQFEPERINVNKFIKIISECFRETISYPHGPVLIGLPQNILDSQWISYNYLLEMDYNLELKNQINNELIDNAIKLINNSRKPVIIVDDFAFRENSKKVLTQLAEILNAPIFQLKYRRGPMLFEQITQDYSDYVVGHYYPTNQLHSDYLNDADLIITIDDRNMYKRVIGCMPDCRKLAITQNADLTIKNNYLKIELGDILLHGSVIEVIDLIACGLKDNNTDCPKDKKETLEIISKLKKENQFVPNKFDFLWLAIINELSKALHEQKNPMIIDDSQMFGGIISEYYNKLPQKTKVYGDHGAFVGAGISCACGAGLIKGDNHVFCTLGDQAFTNGFQGLVCASDEESSVIYLVCNNGKSVSLSKQNAHDIKTEINDLNDLSNFLENSKAVHYSEIAKSLGIQSYKIDLSSITKESIGIKQKELHDALELSCRAIGASVIELIVPEETEVWEGIWSLEGLDTSKK